MTVTDTIIIAAFSFFIGYVAGTFIQLKWRDLN